MSTPEAHANRVLGRIATNPLTWLQHQVEKTRGLSPETLAHIRGQLKKLVKKHGHLKSIPDEIAEREYIRIAYRLNLMRTLEHVWGMKPSDKGYSLACKTLGIWASATLKYKPTTDKQGRTQAQRRAVPTAAMSSGQDRDYTDEAKGNAEDEA